MCFFANFIGCVGKAYDLCTGQNEKPDTIIEDYYKHWAIEETHMTKPERMNKHYRPARALFREGLDLLRRVLLNDKAKGEAISFLELLQVLSRT